MSKRERDTQDTIDPTDMEQVGQQMREMLAKLEGPLQEWLATFGELLAIMARNLTSVVTPFYQALRDRYDAEGQPNGPTDEDMLRWYHVLQTEQQMREATYSQATRWWMLEDFAAQVQHKPRPAPPQRRDYGLEE